MSDGRRCRQVADGGRGHGRDRIPGQFAGPVLTTSVGSGAPSETQSEISSVDSDWSDIRAIAMKLGVQNSDDLHTERFKVDCQKLEQLINADSAIEGIIGAEYFFHDMMNTTDTYVSCELFYLRGTRNPQFPGTRVSPVSKFPTWLPVLVSPILGEQTYSRYSILPMPSLPGNPSSSEVQEVPETECRTPAFGRNLRTADVLLDAGSTTFKTGALIDPCMAVSSLDRSLASAFRLLITKGGDQEVCSTTIRSRTGDSGSFSESTQA
ncbi:hypothetical protein KR054_004958 [Drosophila jambulina]|nr:hypothetical protein KR054_004958 [Drosophila jambulina]